MEKNWILELTNDEMSIIQIAVQRFVKQYANDVFTPEELESTLKIVKYPKHKSL
jgi:hypothetical protein